MSKDTKKKLYLSASRISTFEKCSWLYFQKYVVKTPEPATNSGALMGTCCHNVFEFLAIPRRRTIFDTITNIDSTILNSPAVTRYVKKYIKKHKLPPESFSKIDAMIVVGLLTDFFCDGADEMMEPELEFRIENENPRYNILGFIDRAAKY